MILYTLILLLLNLLPGKKAEIAQPNLSSTVAEAEVCLSKEEKQLHEIINAYRKTKKLKAVPISASLTQVAKAHAVDLMENYKKSDKCNPHSWSKSSKWSGCCYTNDHKQAACMWDKPKEIAGYESPGYEIVYWHSAAAQPEGALKGWQQSKSHNPIIINDGMWNQVEWKAVGVAIHEQYAVVWFGEMDDPKGAAAVCR